MLCLLCQARNFSKIVPVMQVRYDENYNDFDINFLDWYFPNTRGYTDMWMYIKGILHGWNSSGDRLIHVVKKAIVFR